jgi:hypothetical protein
MPFWRLDSTPLPFKVYDVAPVSFSQYVNIRLIVGIPYVEQELHTLLENLNSFPVVSEVRVARSLAFCVMFCRQLFVILAFYFWLHLRICIYLKVRMFTLDWGTIHGVIVFMSKYRINIYF